MFVPQTGNNLKRVRLLKRRVLFTHLAVELRCPLAVKARTTPWRSMTEPAATGRYWSPPALHTPPVPHRPHATISCECCQAVSWKPEIHIYRKSLGACLGPGNTGSRAHPFKRNHFISFSSDKLLCCRSIICSLVPPPLPEKQRHVHVTSSENNKSNILGCFFHSLRQFSDSIMELNLHLSRLCCRFPPSPPAFPPSSANSLLPPSFAVFSVFRSLQVEVSGWNILLLALQIYLLPVGPAPNTDQHPTLISQFN